MSDKRWAFVTGASTGIGRASVERLASDGWNVIAGVRKDGDQPSAATAHVLVDVSDADQVEAAAKQVSEIAGGRLYGLVNNAGISVSGPFEVLSVDDYRRQFDVNFFGHLAITQLLLPMLLETKGRIVTIGSIGGRMATPFLSPYNASKFAIRGWSDAARVELAPHGVGVVLVEPGSIATEIWGKGNASAFEVLARMTPEQGERYAKQIAGVFKVAQTVEKNAIPAAKVADAVARALTARKPKPHVVVGTDARVQAILAVLPGSVRDKALALAMKPPKQS